MSRGPLDPSGRDVIVDEEMDTGLDNRRGVN